MIMLMVMICSDGTDGDECVTVTKDPMAARSKALEIEGIEQEPRLWVPELNYLRGFFHVLPMKVRVNLLGFWGPLRVRVHI